MFSTNPTQLKSKRSNKRKRKRKFEPKPIRFDELPDSAFIRLNELIATKITPFSRSSLWRKIRDAEFPPPDKISDQITAFRVGTIRVWQADPAGFKAAQAKNGGQK